MMPPAKRARLERGEKGLLITTVVFVALIGGLAWWWDEINRNPVVTIPTPVMPSPNARDFYIKASTSFAWHESSRVMDGARDGTLPSLDAGATPVKPKSPASHPLTLAEAEAGVKKNQPALAILREGFNYDYGEPPARSASHLFPHFAKFRETARALIADGYVKAIHGDWPGAANSYLDAMEMGATSSRGGPLISGLVGIALQAIGRGEMWRTVDHLNATAATSAARRLESLMAKQPAYADTMEEEKYCGQAMLLEMFRKPRKEWASFFGGEESLVSSLVASTINKRQVMANYTAYMDKKIAELRKPAPTRKPVPVPTDLISRFFVPVFNKAEFKWTINDAYNRLLLTRLALRAYRVEHGAYPAKLANLCPKYLAKVPDDPFALRGPLCYKVTGSGYLLYSIGPDGKDDAGTPSKDGQKHAATKGATAIKSTSTGDLVASVNVQ